MIIPSLHLVIVSRVANDPPQRDAKSVVAAAERTIVSTPKTGEIVKMILAAQTR
jgi:hypothetical protein